MSDRPTGNSLSRKPGPTGGYAYCPNSGTTHALFAKQVHISKKGAMWFRCVCGTRVYFPSGNPVPTLTREQAIASGAVIPDELTVQTPIPFPVQAQWQPQWQPPPPAQPARRVQ